MSQTRGSRFIDLTVAIALGLADREGWPPEEPDEWTG